MCLVVNSHQKELRKVWSPKYKEIAYPEYMEKVKSQKVEVWNQE